MLVNILSLRRRAGSTYGATCLRLVGDSRGYRGCRRICTSTYITLSISNNHHIRFSDTYQLGQVVSPLHQILLNQILEPLEIGGGFFEPLSLVAEISVQLHKVFAKIVDRVLVSVHELFVFEPFRTVAPELWSTALVCRVFEDFFF